MKPRAMSLFRVAISPTSLAGMNVTQLGRCPWSCFDRRLGQVRGGNPGPIGGDSARGEGGASFMVATSRLPVSRARVTYWKSLVGSCRGIVCSDERPRAQPRRADAR